MEEVVFCQLASSFIGIVEFFLALMIANTCYKKTTLKNTYKVLSIFISVIFIAWLHIYIDSFLMRIPLALGVVLLNIRLRHKMKWTSLLYVILLWGSVLVISDTLASAVWGSYSELNGLTIVQTHTIRTLIGIASNVIAIVFVHFCYRIAYRKDIPFAWKQLLLHLGPFTTLMTIHIIIKALIGHNITSNQSIVLIMVCMGLLVSNVHTWEIFEDAIRSDRQKREYAYLQSKMKEQYNHYLDIEKNHSEIRKLWHDMHNHLICIEELINRDCIDDAKCYLKQVNATMVDVKGGVRTGNFIVDILLSEKYHIAVTNNITLKIQVQGSLLSFIQDIDLCIIYGNLLDNALDACLKMQNISTNLKPIIYVQTIEIKGVVTIRVSNTYLTPIVEKDGQLVSTKEDTSIHGIGLKNIKSVVSKYDGAVHIQYENNYFDVQIIF